MSQRTVLYDDLLDRLNWMKVKTELNYSEHTQKFPILYNGIYWAHLGYNIGHEQNKRRPVIVTRTYRGSSIVPIIPLTTKHLNDQLDCHIDLEATLSTALVEQMRTIDVRRIDKPMMKGGRIMQITQRDFDRINQQIISRYTLRP